ncbi:glycosyltransferase family 2 protein [Conexibacter sp. S30A1]|uniref:glycosyltransferase family 2 protein n=1 Tax=Conexibacter sp. S30A1 TaxID=2937800 RepID=UPI00200DD99C|nr:glycosyltransferase [Conexibacter sp. S30A1]
MLSIVIPVKDGGDDLARCLAAIDAQIIDEPVEIIAVDSGSSDDSVETALRHGATVLRIPPEEFTHGGSRNLGAEHAHGRILVFISQDALPMGTGWLSALVAPLRDDENVAGVYGRQLAHPEAAAAEVYFLNFMYGPNGRRQRARSVAQVSMDTTLFSNVNSAIRRELWQRFPFSSDIVMSEDQEWSRRVLLAGYDLIYEPHAPVRHSHSYTLLAAFRRFFDSGVSAERAYMTAESHSASVLRGRAARYVVGEVWWLWRTGKARLIPYNAIYELAKMLGLLAGLNHRRIPLSLKRRFTGLPNAFR